VKADAFDELLESVRQAGAIRRGERKPTRSRTFKPTDVKAVRADLGQSQAEFALMIGVKDPINPKEIVGVSNPANQYLPAYGPFERMRDILVDTRGYINVLRYTGPIKN
jgi:hypothetical protein